MHTIVSLVLMNTTINCDETAKRPNIIFILADDMVFQECIRIVNPMRIEIKLFKMYFRVGMMSVSMDRLRFQHQILMHSLMQESF